MRARVTVLFSLAGLLLAAAPRRPHLLAGPNAALQPARRRSPLQQAFVNASARAGPPAGRPDRRRNEVIRQVRPDSGGVRPGPLQQRRPLVLHAQRPLQLRTTSRTRSGGTCSTATPAASGSSSTASPTWPSASTSPSSTSSTSRCSRWRRCTRSLRVVGGSLVLGSAVAAVARRRRRVVGQPAPAAPGLPRGRRRQRAGVRRSSTPASSPSGTRTSTGSSARSTTWPTPSRTASSARPASPPTSATSCAPPSPRSRPPSRCWTAAATSFPTAASRPSTWWSTRSSASTRWCSTCSSCPGSTPGVDDSHLEPVVPGRDGQADRDPQRVRPRCPSMPAAVSEVPILLDKRRLERIVVNLLDNARNHADGPGTASPWRTAPAARVRSGGRGLGTGRAPGRAGPHLRALLPGHGGPPPGRHRPRPGAGERARHGHGRPGLGRGSSRRRCPLRRVVAGGPSMTSAAAPDRDGGGRWAAVVGDGRLGLRRGGRARAPYRRREDDIRFGLAETSTSTTTTTTTSTVPVTVATTAPPATHRPGRAGQDLPGPRTAG